MCLRGRWVFYRELVGNRRLIRVIGDDPDIANKGTAVTLQLLEACAKILADRGVRGMLVDGIRGGEELQSMGRCPALRSEDGSLRC